MAVDLLDFSPRHSDHDAHQAFSAGLRSFHSLLHLLSEPSSSGVDGLPQQQKRIFDCSVMADATISDFRRASSLLSRSGHARFRRAPSNGAANQNIHTVHVLPPAPDAVDLPTSRVSTSPCASRTAIARVSKMPSGTGVSGDPQTEDAYASKTAIARAKVGIREAETKSHICDPSSASGTIFARGKEGAQYHNQKHQHQHQSSHNHQSTRNSCPMQTGPHCMPQGLPCEENSMSTSRRLAGSSVSNDDGGSIVNPKKSVLSRFGLPPLPPNRKRPSSQNESESRKCKSQRTCHCAHNRASRNRRIVKISACSMNASDVPVDEFSWKKIGHKSIHGSPYPRNYYKCDSVKGCPARKLVERSMVEAEILIITYDGEHNH